MIWSTGCIDVYFRRWLRLVSLEYGGPEKGCYCHRDGQVLVYTGLQSMSEMSKPLNSSKLLSKMSSSHCLSAWLAFSAAIMINEYFAS